MDFAAFARDVAADLAAAREVVCPTFSTPGPGGGNDNLSQHQGFTHTSHVSHSAGMGAAVDHARRAAPTQVAVSASADARDEAALSKMVGNVGSVGNVCRSRDLVFPPRDVEVGKTRVSGKPARGRAPSTSTASCVDAPTFDERAAFLEYECGLTRDRAEAQALAEQAAGVLSADEVPSEGVGLWRAGVAGLSPHRPPCPDYRPGEWPAVHARALAFLDAFGAQAEALGWTASRLFGVHPEIGTTRVDCCGGLVLGIGGPVLAITRTKIRFGLLTYRIKPGQPAGVPIWNFGR